MSLIERWIIRNPPGHRHERATCDVRTAPADTPDAVYKGDVVVVPAEQLQGAVDAILDMADVLDRVYPIIGNDDLAREVEAAASTARSMYARGRT